MAIVPGNHSRTVIAPETAIISHGIFENQGAPPILPSTGHTAASNQPCEDVVHSERAWERSASSATADDGVILNLD